MWPVFGHILFKLIMNNNVLRLLTFYMLLPLKMVSLYRIMIWTDELEGNQLQHDTSDLATLMIPPVSLKAQTYTPRTCLNMGIPCDQ